MASRDIYARTVDEDVYQNDHNTCSECSGIVTANRSETVCDACGFILTDERIDRGLEWREFDDDCTSNRRARSPITVVRHYWGDSSSPYPVCRLIEYPRTFGETDEGSKISAERVKLGYSTMNSQLDLPVSLVDSEYDIAQIASEVHAFRETERRANELLEEADGNVIANGQHSAGTAAGALKLAARNTGELITQEAVVDSADVMTMTIRDRSREIHR